MGSRDTEKRIRRIRRPDETSSVSATQNKSGGFACVVTRLHSGFVLLGTHRLANLEAPNSRRETRIARQRGAQGPARERKTGPDHDPSG